MYTPVNLSFTVKVGFKGGQNYIGVFLWWDRLPGQAITSMSKVSPSLIFEKESTLKESNLLPVEDKYRPFFRRGLVREKANWKSQKHSPMETVAE